MRKREKSGAFEQMSVSRIMNLPDDRENTFGSADLSGIIDKLTGVKRKMESIEAM